MADHIALPLVNGGETLVDQDVAAWARALPWQRDARGYARCDLRRVDGRPGRETVYLHRLVLGLAPTGGPHRGPVGGHRNGDRLDNRRANLRAVENTLNMALFQRHARGQSGFRGVTWHAQHGKWLARITVDRRTTFLGLYDDAAVAARAYDDAARRLRGPDAPTNFPADGGEATPAVPAPTTGVAA